MRPDHLFSGFYRLRCFWRYPPTLREGIDIVGSSTVYPFSTVAAERFAQITGGQVAERLNPPAAAADWHCLRRLRRKNARYYQRFAADKKIGAKNCAPKTALAKCWKLKSAMNGIVIAQSIQGAAFALTRRGIVSCLGA